MKLFFIIYADNTFGGGRYSIFKFAEYLAHLGNLVTVLVIGKPVFINKESSNSYPKSLTIKFLPTISFYFKGVGIINKLITTIYFTTKVSAFLTKNSPDYLIGYQKQSTIDIIRLGKIFHIKTASFVFESPDWLASEYPEWTSNPHKMEKELRLWKHFKKFILLSDVIFPNSPITKTNVEAWLDRAISKTIYPGIELSDLAHGEKARNKTSILFIGRLVKHKNVDLLIKAVSMIESSVSLIICGDGPEKNKLMNLAETHHIKIKFTGIISDEKKWQYISTAGIMAFPSAFEGFGMPPMEALFCGTPCIVSDIPIFRCIYGNHLEYCTLNDVDDLRNEIEKIIGDYDRYLLKCEQGKQFIMDKFNWRNSATDIDKELRKLMS